MKALFSVNEYKKEIFIHLEDGKFSIKFESLKELSDFATDITHSIIPEIVEHYYDDLSEEDQAEFSKD